MFEECGRIREMSGHMYSLACSMVVSDLPGDANRRSGDKKLQGGQSRLIFLTMKIKTKRYINNQSLL
jgi:hypothetical protein